MNWVEQRKIHGQVMLKARVPDRSLKLSSYEPGQYFDGWPVCQTKQSLVINNCKMKDIQRDDFVFV